MNSEIVSTLNEIDFTQFELAMIVIYFSPTDFKGKYVARIFDINNPTRYCMVKETYQEIKNNIPYYFTKLGRHENDDITIKEVWV